MKFKVGDRVIFIDERHPEYYGKVYTIKSIEHDRYAERYNVIYCHGMSPLNGWYPRRFKLYNKRPEWEV